MSAITSGVMDNSMETDEPLQLTEENAVGALAIGFEPCQWQLLTGRDWIKECNFCAMGEIHVSFMQAVRSVCAGGAKSTQPFKRSQSVGSVSSDAFVQCTPAPTQCWVV